MLKKYYKYISVNLLALAGYIQAVVWLYVYFTEYLTAIKNDSLYHSMEDIGVMLIYYFLYKIGFFIFLFCLVVFICEKLLRKKDKTDIKNRMQKAHYYIVTSGFWLFMAPTILFLILIPVVLIILPLLIHFS